MEDLHDLESLTRVLRLPSAWLQRQAIAGRIPALRLGKSFLRFHLPTVNVDAHREAPDSDHVGASLPLVPVEPCEGDLVLSWPQVRAPA